MTQVHSLTYLAGIKCASSSIKSLIISTGLSEDSEVAASAEEEGEGEVGSRKIAKKRATSDVQPTCRMGKAVNSATSPGEVQQ